MDTELRKKTKKKKVISAAIVATSAYASVLFTGGLLVGYLGMKYFYDKYIKDDPSKFLYVNIKGWEIHLHHWIIGALILIYLIMGGWQFESHKIILGLICGMALHDIYDFNDWHKFIVGKKQTA